jgi:transposase-like protein
MTIKGFENFSKEEKKVIAKTLYNMGWSSRKLEQWLGLSDNTIQRAVKQPTPEEMKRFEAEFKLAIQNEKMKGVALGIKRLLELLPKERRIEPLVKGLEYLEGKGQAPLVVNQTIFTQLKQKYGQL